MSRDFKFKAWDNELEEWCGAFSQAILINGGFIAKDIEQEHFTGYGVKPDGTRRFTIVQHTGLLDKNGKEIYEGDIVKTSVGNKVWHYAIRCYTEFDCNLYGDTIYRNFYYDEETDTYIYQDKHMNERSRKSLYGSERSFEVIGNIWENKELLTKEN